MNDTWMWEEIFEQPEALNRCEAANAAVLREAALAARQVRPRSIVIAARGTSDHVATFARYLFEIYLKIPVSLAAPSVFTAYGAQVDLSGSLVIGISQSGAAADVLEVLRCANAQGAVTIAVTNTPGSPLAKNCRFHLYCNAQKEKSVAATKTFTTQLYLMLRLVSLLSDDASLIQALEDVPTAVRYALSLAPLVEEHAARFRFMEECFVLSRGVAYPIAMEAALKIQETCYVRAKCYSVSDFHHGPFAMVDRDIPAILIDVDPCVRGDVREMMKKLREQKVFQFLISNDEENIQKADLAVPLPAGMSAAACCFAAAVVSQMFACALSVQRGNNPDAPRGLNKVTITK